MSSIFTLWNSITQFDECGWLSSCPHLKPVFGGLNAKEREKRLHFSRDDSKSTI